jgi:type III secretion system YscI/HrpB-like protein
MATILSVPSATAATAAAASIAAQPDPSQATGSVPPASVAAFNALMAASGTPQAPVPVGGGLLGELFGTSATPHPSVAWDAAPILRIPDNFSYASGAARALDRIFPALPGALPSPHEMFAAQMQVSSIQLGWQLTGKLVGTSVQGFNTLVNSQV